MAEERTATKARRRWRVLLALALLACALVALRNVLVAPWLLARLAERLRNEHGLELDASGASGNWITSLAIEELRLRSSDPELAWDLRVEGAELDYDLRDLLRGEGEGLRRVSVRSVSGSVRMRGGEAANEAEGTRELRERLAWLPGEIRVGRLDFDFELPGTRRIALRSGSLALRSSDFELGVGRALFEGEWPVALRELSMSVRGHLGRNELSLERLETAGDIALSLERGLVRATEVGIESELAGTLDGTPISMFAREQDGAWTFDGRVDSLDLGRLGTRILALQELGLGGAASAAGRLLLDERGAWCEARLEANDVCCDGVAVEALSAELLLRPGWIELPRIEVRQSDNLLWGSGLELPLAQGSMLEFLQAARGKIELAIHDIAAIEAEPAAWIGPHRIALAGELGPRGLAIEQARLETAKGRMVVRNGSLGWREPLAEATELALEGDLYFADLAELGALLDARPWAGSARGTLEISGTLGEPQGRLGLRGEGVVIDGYALGDIEARARIDGARVEVLSLRALGQLGQFDLQGAFDWRARAIETATLRASVPALEALLPERFERGVVALDARLEGSLEALSGELDVEALDLATRDGLELDWLNASARFTPERLDVERLALSGFGVVAHARGSLVHAAWTGPMLLEVEQATLVREGVGLVLERPAALDLDVDERSLVAPELALNGLRGDLLLAAGWRAGQLELDARFDDVEPMPLLAPFLGPGMSVGDVDGRVSVRQEAGRYELAANVRATRLVPGGGWPVLELELAARAGGERATVEQCRLRAGEVLSLSLDGEFPFDEREPWKLAQGTLQASAELRLGDAGLLPWRELGLPGPVAGALQARARLAGLAPDLRGFAELQGERLSIAPVADGGVVSTLGLGDGTLRARVTLNGALALEEFALAARPGVRIDARGTLFERAALEGWWRERRAPWLEVGTDLATSWSIENLAVLADLTPVLRRTAGTTRGEVRVEGALASPRLTGRAELRDGEVRIDANFPALQRLAGEFQLDGERVLVERLRGELGAGPFEIGGSLRLLPRLELDLAIRGRELLVVQRPDLRVRADADLKLSGPLDALVLRGELSPQDSRWSRNFDWFRPRTRGGLGREASPPLFSIDKGALSTLRFDVRLRGGEPFRIDSNVARGSLRPDLALTGTGRAPVLTGALFLDPTLVPLPAATLELRAGTLAIDRRDPLDPVLDFSLSARVRGYDIAIRASGRYSAPELELSSVPPLPGEDILLLLLTGRAPGAALTGDDGIDAAETVIVYLGKDLISRLFDGEGSMMERVEFQTGADVTQNGGSTAQVRIRVSGRAEGTGRAIYLRGERDIYDRINFGARFVMRLR